MGGVELTKQVRKGFDQLPGKQHKQSFKFVCDPVSQSIEGQQTLFRSTIQLWPIKQLQEWEESQSENIYIGDLHTTPDNITHDLYS